MAIKNQEQPRVELDQFTRLKKLWVAVIKRAIDDLFSPNQSIKSNAHWYIYNDSSEFRGICDIIELNCDLVRSTLNGIDKKTWLKNKKLSYFRVDSIEKPKRRKQSNG